MKSMLYGRYEHTVDAKNRMFVPAKFKEALGASFKVTYNDFNKCILVYSDEEWAKYEEKISQLPTLQFEDFIRAVYSNTVDVQVDSQGRIVIPQFLKDKVSIQKNVLVLGVGSHLEIWAQEEYAEKQKAVDMDKIKGLMMELRF
ncbi:MAG: division/cell wall cluster transcriptional repressor MraZ [Clostridia bacterium]|nr:division/cell wall cluster transcriptional repressor MraZ [Clostridia bacterium]